MAALVDRISEVLGAWDKAVQAHDYGGAIQVLNEGAKGFADQPDVARSIRGFVELTRDWQRRDAAAEGRTDYEQPVECSFCHKAKESIALVGNDGAICAECAVPLRPMIDRQWNTATIVRRLSASPKTGSCRVCGKNVDIAFLFNVNGLDQICLGCARVCLRSLE